MASLFDRNGSSASVSASEERWYQSLFERYPDAVISVNQQGRVVAVNQAYAKTAGYCETECLGKPLAELLALHSEELTKESRIPLSGDGESRQFEAELIRKDGRRIVRRVLSIPVVVDGEVVGMHAIVKGPVRKRQQSAKRREPVQFKGLASLPDRTLFTQQLQEAIEEAKQNETMLAILFIDLDRFKFVNDVLGHQQGDRLLQEASEKLQACLRDGDVVARIGGDKFTLFARNLRQVKQVVRIAGKILSRFQEPFILDGHEFFITPSIGISMYPLGGKDADELLKFADTAMFRAKEKGGNTYEIFDASMNMQITERLALESSLRKAVERNELEIYYQPQMDLRTRRLCGMEALLRWNHAEKGFVPPDRFIPIAEETGLILPITEWLIEQVCRQNKNWQAEGLTPVRISVNLSALQFGNSDLTALVERITQASGLDPKWLGLEITESVLMKNTRDTVETLQQLRAMGVYISVDDFGTGYSSLGYLKRFPIDCLKIDRAFVRNVMHDSDNAAIVRAIITLADHMKLRVIAEGVETHDELLYLASSGCDAVQGYLIGKPMPAESCRRLLATADKRGVLLPV